MIRLLTVVGALSCVWSLSVIAADLTKVEGPLLRCDVRINGGASKRPSSYVARTSLGGKIEYYELNANPAGLEVIEKIPTNTMVSIQGELSPSVVKGYDGTLWVKAMLVAFSGELWRAMVPTGEGSMRYSVFLNTVFGNQYELFALPDQWKDIEPLSPGTQVWVWGKPRFSDIKQFYLRLLVASVHSVPGSGFPREAYALPNGQRPARSVSSSYAWSGSSYSYNRSVTNPDGCVVPKWANPTSPAWVKSGSYLQWQNGKPQFGSWYYQDSTGKSVGQFSQ